MASPSASCMCCSSASSSNTVRCALWLLRLEGISLVLLCFFRSVSLFYLGCGEYLFAVYPQNGGMVEMGWSLAHWIGFRNVGAVVQFLPGFSNTLFAAHASGVPHHAQIALTIDDVVGDNSSGFASLLDLLSQLQVNATFFTIANDNTIGKGKELLQRAAREGHEVGNHGLQDAAMIGMSRAEFGEAIELWEQRIRGILPIWPQREKWFRPPKGLMNPVIDSVLEERGYRVALGDVYSDDWLLRDAAFHKRVLQGAACDGSIIILHVPDRPGRLQTLDIVREAVPRLQARGFKMATLSELFAQAHGSNPVFYSCVAALSSSALFLIALCAMGVFMIVRPFFYRRRRRRSARQPIGYKKMDEPGESHQSIELPAS